MHAAWAVDWKSVWLPSHPLEVMVRGSVMYLALFFLLRAVLKRETSGFSVTDILVVVLIADAAQNAMAGDYQSLPDGILLVATIVGWALALQWVAHRFPRLRRVIRAAAIPIVRDGRLLRRNLARELVTEEELMSQLRLQGVNDLDEVEAAFIEADGRISVVTHDRERPKTPPEARTY